MYSCGFDYSISEGLVESVVIMSINDFEMSTRYVFRMFLSCGQLDILKFKVFLSLFHTTNKTLEDFIINFQNNQILGFCDGSYRGVSRGVIFLIFRVFKSVFFYIQMEVRVLEGQNEIYQKEKLLGEGAFGKAYLVKHKQTGQLLVIKEVSIEHMSQKEREETIKQAQILRNFKHPLIVKFVQVYATKQNKLKIVMEYAQCGDLSKAINARKTSKKYFEENQILDWFTQLCLAMKHVHDRKILHRDIKGQNIFITKANTLKLGDFGIARVLNKTQDKARTVVGTPYYLSPEIIENKPYSFKSDVWSMGVLLYELCALTPPFTANSLQLLALKIVKGSHSQLAGNYSKDIKGMVEDMLQIDPNRRPSVGDILKKPFLQDRIRKFLSETYRKDEFSHTVLHNQKVEISNQLVKIQQQKNIVKNNEELEKERNQLKEEAVMLREKMERKKAEEAAALRKRAEEKLRDQERMRRKRDEDQRKKEDDLQRRREEQQKQREFQQKKAIEERKQWVQREKRRQQENNRNLQEEQHKRVQQIAMMARRRDQDQQNLYSRKQKLIQEKYELERQRDNQDQEIKKRQNKQKQSKKMEEFNDFARKQWYQNQMIRKRAEERARQTETESYSEPSQPVKPFQEQKLPSRPQSNRNSRQNSRQKPHYEPHKKHSMPTAEPTSQQLQNALLNPNFGKKTPQSANSKSKQTESKQSTNGSSWNPKPKEDFKKREQKVDDSKVKKSYNEDREKIKRDREEFLKNKGLKSPTNNELIVEQTLKPAKWGNSRQKSKSHESPIRSKISPPRKSQQQPVPAETMMLSEELRLDIKDQEEFNDYLKELEGLIGNVNKNIQNMEKPEPFPEIPVVQEEIVVREDDAAEFEYSITGSFDNLQIPKKEEVDVENADFDYFSSYSKLQELRMCLQDKFGTQNFIKIYRTLEDEYQKKGLQNFNIIQVIKEMGSFPNSNLVADNLPLLLTLIVMQERMSST